MVKVLLVIEVETGSEFQTHCTKELFQIYGSTLKVAMESRHKKNKAEWRVEVTEPLNGKEKTRKTR